MYKEMFISLNNSESEILKLLLSHDNIMCQSNDLTNGKETLSLCERICSEQK
jgi:hypothetical protein